ncbi:MAG: hypothetical protein WAK21_10025 [Candidatus Sulfotelmatobacter sp.]
MDSAQNAQPVIVTPKFGGQILGYAIDPSGTEGVLSESVAQSNGNNLAATETFSQSTGKILNVIAKTDSQDDFVTEGVFGNTALILHQHGGKNFYNIVNPLEQNKFNGAWKPPIKPNFDFWTLAGTGASPNVAAYQVSFQTGQTFVFSSNVANNTFGPQISLASIQDVDEFFQPQIALDSATNQAVLADSPGCPEPGCVTSLALVNLLSGEISKFTQNLGLGVVDGLAVDPATGTAVTTTSADGGVEFYNLANQSGFEIIIPNFDGIATDSGLSVAFDPVHSLFLISQWSSNGGNTNDPQPRVYVYDEQGTVLETIDVQRIPISPVPMVLNASKRVGFIMEIGEGQSAFTVLQSFSY